MSIFEALAAHRFGELTACLDERTGLRALVALYSTRLGPAIGGCRVRAYPTEADAVDDVLRLARAMAYKAALANLPHGGGKAVILAPAAGQPLPDRAALFRRFGQFVDGLGGRYITTEDSGTSTADMDVVRQTTRHVLGSSAGSGDPSPFTATGVRRGIEAVSHAVLGRADLRGLRVAVQGVGHVGTHLARELARAGVELTITDVDPQRRQAIALEVGARTVEPTAIFEVDCDVLAPCALGGALTEDIAARLRCRAIAGAANNQLATPAVGGALAARGIFYAPDYAINAGGLISVAHEYAHRPAADTAAAVHDIYATIAAIVERCRQSSARPEEVADRMAEEKIGS